MTSKSNPLRIRSPRTLQLCMPHDDDRRRAGGGTYNPVDVEYILKVRQAFRGWARAAALKTTCLLENRQESPPPLFYEYTTRTTPFYLRLLMLAAAGHGRGLFLSHFRRQLQFLPRHLTRQVPLEFINTDGRRRRKTKERGTRPPALRMNGSALKKCFQLLRVKGGRKFCLLQNGN